jgi:acyl-CoA thioester hydrolase
MSTRPDPLPDAAHHVHTAVIPVRWGDMDAAGHVNNSRFFGYFEEARVEWLKDTLDASMFEESGPVLARATCDFERPVHHPATLEVEVYVEPPGRSSLPTHYVARLAETGEGVATGTAVLVWVNVETGTPVAVPELGLQ